MFTSPLLPSSPIYPLPQFYIPHILPFHSTLSDYHFVSTAFRLFLSLNFYVSFPLSNLPLHYPPISSKLYHLHPTSLAVAPFLFVFTPLPIPPLGSPRSSPTFDPIALPRHILCNAPGLSPGFPPGVSSSQPMRPSPPLFCLLQSL